jgi:hypothetical protein
MFLEVVNEKLKKFFKGVAELKYFGVVITNQDNICEKFER